MDIKLLPLFVTFDPGVSPRRSKSEKSITRLTLVSPVRQACTTVADRVCCEKQAAAWSVTADVVNYLCFAVIGDRHVGIYASPDNWRTCYPHIPIGMLWIYWILTANTINDSELSLLTSWTKKGLSLIHISEPTRPY